MNPAERCLILGSVLWILGSHSFLLDEPEYIIVDTSVCPRDVDYPRCGIDPVDERSECWTDQDCKAKRKCCFYGCRRRCLLALRAKSGSCPRLNTTLCSNKIHLLDECRHDEQCPGSSKCCDRCGLWCSMAVRTQEQKPPPKAVNREDTDGSAESAGF